MQKAFTYLPDVESRFDDNEDKKDSDQQLLWLDNFESLARRRNEPWRVELLSRAIAEIELSSRSISLKALWELGMLEEDDFNLLAIFCDSALDVDGRPLMLILPEEQIKFELDSKDGAGVYNLAYAVNMLVDKRLVQKIETQVETSCPVLLKHSMGAHYLHHTIENLSEDSKTAIQIIAFEPTDYCLDICRLYDPDHNSVSYANFEILKNTLEEGSEKVENFGLVDFKEVLP